MSRNRFSNAFVAVTFAVGITLPLIQQTTGLLPRVAVVDNRQLAPLPSLSPARAAIPAFPARFDAWYADHMGLRGALVTSYRWMTDAVLRSPDKVIIGRDDWLYLRRGVREDIDAVPLVRDWCGRFTFSERQIQSWVDAIAANRDWLAARGIDYLFVIPPNKMTVIPGHLPDRFQCRRGRTRLEQLERALAERRGIRLVDFRDILRRAAGSGESIWHRTDTHWNPRGVAAAYPLLMERIRTLQPAARRVDSFEVYAHGRDFGDLGRMIRTTGLESDIVWAVSPADPRSRPVPASFGEQTDVYGRGAGARSIDDPELPRALVFHDSFFDGAMNSFLGESFSRSVFVHHSHPQINRALVEQARPDIVIHEMVERNLLHPFFPR